MAVRRQKNSITVSGDDLTDLKAALKKLLRPAEVPWDHAQCPCCGDILKIFTTEQTISGTCDPCWDEMFPADTSDKGNSTQDTGSETKPF